MEERWSAAEQAGAERMLACSVVGSPETVLRGIEAFIARTEADEVLVTAQIFDPVARLRSFEIVAEARDALRGTGLKGTKRYSHASIQ
jgi:alkanesulfonate monooxygenase SsuD/methylene tetrahydromethanopterin reductase-like flavin-dependent oxidoreductase (luciferase family)